jgi:GNAT superfamily N-acetyltransferase
MDNIRSACLEDAEAIVGLTCQLGYPTEISDTRERLAYMISDSNHEVLVYEDGALLGWLGLAVVHSLTSDPHPELLGLVVEEAARSRGIGAKLMGAAEAWAISRGFEHLRLRTNLKRTDAHRFYERLGYVPVKEQRVYERPL